MMINEHLQYEYEMMKCCYISLERHGHNSGEANETYPPLSSFYVNVLHEAFCIHCNNLIRYFAKEYNTEDLAVNRIYDRIWDQVITLGPRRTATMNEKIGGPERTYLYEWINKQWELRSDDPTFGDSIQ